MNRKLWSKEFGLFAALFLVSICQGAPEGSKIKFPESASEDSVASASTEAEKVIDEILSASRSGRDLQLNVGGKDISEPLALSSDPKFQEVSGKDTEARSYVATKLCSLGLAKCGESSVVQGRHSHYGSNGGITNIRDVTLVQPVALKPVGEPIAAIPLENNRPYGGGSIGGGSSYNPSGGSSYNPSGFGNYPSEDKNFPSYNRPQGGLISSQQDCTCVSVSQCNSYDIINQQQSATNGNNGVINGLGSPNFGHVGSGIDPRNKKSSEPIESNATIIESAVAVGVSRIKRDVSHLLPNSNPRVVNGGYRSCYDDRQVCCRNPIRNPGGVSSYPADRPSYQPSGGVSSYPVDSYRPPSSYPSQNKPVSNEYYPPTGSSNFGSGNGACGKRNSNGINGRVLSGMYSGNSAEYGEYPWQVAILKKEGANSVFVCGGSIIDSRHLLTAAHCIKSHRPEDLRVRLGEWDVNTENEFYPHVEVDVAAIAIHPEYYAGNLVNDIAIIKLNGYVDFSKYPQISPICLPARQYDFTGMRCFATGWGKDAFNGGKFQRVLQEVDVPVVNHYECEQRLRRTRLGPDFTLHQGFICAGGEPEKDACKGDGGGPLSCEVGGTWQLAGIVSWGVGCGSYGTPGVYVKTSSYLDWIRQTIQ